MTMKRTHNVTLTTGEYEKDGEQKKKRVNIGVMLTDDQTGNMSLCLDVAPTFKINKDGYPEAWLSLFPIDNNRQQPAQPQQQFGAQPTYVPQQNVAPQYQQPNATQQPPQQYQQQPANMAPPQLDSNGMPF